MSKTFLNSEKPLITCMVQADTPQRIRELVSLSIPEGADAFGMQFCKLNPEYRNRQTYCELFALTEGRPVYVTNYRVAQNASKSEDTLAEELIELAECGATLCDVMGDTFDRPAGEPTIVGAPTMNEEAVKKQIKLIDELHARGAEVLMSSHIMKFTPAERVLEMAREHRRRGADISKIVVAAETPAEEIENLRISNMLREELDFPFLFLSSGECSRIIRRIGSCFGSCMSLCVYEQDAFSTKAQPLLRDVKAIEEILG